MASIAAAKLVFLFDVDDTLLDNDAVQKDFHEHIEAEYGAAAGARYWALYEKLFKERGYADYLGALEQLRIERVHEPRLLRLGNWLIDYPFSRHLYAGAVEAVRHAAGCGTAVVLSDGDAVFQPRKVERSGLWALFEGKVLIFPHKERQLAEIEQLYPAQHYVLIDDKLRILDAVKRQWRDRVTTVFPRQGHYAHDPAILAQYPPADVMIESIGELTRLDVSNLGRAWKKVAL